MHEHLGNIIAKKMFEKRIAAKELAKQLDITTVAVYQMLNRKYIHPKWLEKISRIIGYDLYLHIYRPPDDFLQKKKEEEQRQITNEISVLKKQLEDLQKENAYLKEINELLKKKGK